MRRAMAAARRRKQRAVLLVGDAPYYCRFGFSGQKTAALWLPGPYERDRLLACELTPGALDGARGLIGATGRLSRPRASRPRRRTWPRRGICPSRGLTIIRNLGTTNMNAMTNTTTAWPLHAHFDGPIVMIGFGSIGRGTLPLIERHIGFDRIEVRRHRSGRRRSRPARRAQAHVHPCGDHQGELPRGAHAAAHRGARPRHDRQSVGRHLVGRPDGILPRTSTPSTSTRWSSRGPASTPTAIGRSRSARTMRCAKACSICAAGGPAASPP